MNEKPQKKDKIQSLGKIIPKTLSTLRKISENETSKQNLVLAKADLNLNINQMLKIADKESIRQEIGKSIAIVITDLGVKTMPDKYAQKRIVYYLLSYYKDFSIEEIRLAFELAIVGKLEIEIEHYQSFDIKYLSKILNAYRKYRNEKKLRIRAEQMQEPKEPTAKEIRISKIKYLKTLSKTYENYKNTGVLNRFIHWVAYNQLIEIQVLEISENYWVELIQRSEKIYKTQLKKSKKKENKEILKQFETVKYIYPFELSRIRNIAKKLAIQDFFESLKRNNENLNEIFIKTGSYE